MGAYKRKNVYIASKFNKVQGSSLKEQLAVDLHTKIVQNFNRAYDIVNAVRNGLPLGFGYSYVGPFYCEEASNGVYTSTSCKDVVNKEIQAVSQADKFIVYFDSKYSCGSVVELIYAAMTYGEDKSIDIIYETEPNNDYELKSEHWFAIQSALQLTKAKISIEAVNNEDEALEYILNILKISVDESKQLKDFELILPSFRCNRDCPYCTAKITNWEKRDLNLNNLDLKLAELTEKGYHFKYFILCGNGEPSLYSDEIWRRIWDIVEKHRDLFDDFRVQTSGNLFDCGYKLEYLRETGLNVIIEITRVSFDSEEDMKVLGNAREYIYSKAFKYWKRIRLNMVMLKGITAEKVKEQVEQYTLRFDNIETVSIKTLNLNTKTGDTNNQYSQWILNNAISRDDCMELVQKLTGLLGDAVVEYKDRFIWMIGNTEVTLYSAKGKQYGDTHMVYYGDELVDFKLNKIEL